MLHDPATVVIIRQNLYENVQRNVQRKRSPHYKCCHVSMYVVTDNIAECCICYKIYKHLLSCK